jgi:ribosomal protein S27E
LRECLICEWSGPSDYIFCPDCGWQLIESEAAEAELAEKHIHSKRLRIRKKLREKGSTPGRPTCPWCGEAAPCLRHKEVA